MHPEVNSSITPYDTVTTSHYHTTYTQNNNRPLSEIRSTPPYYMNGTQSNKNIKFNLVNPNQQFNQMQQSQTVNRSLQYQG